MRNLYPQEKELMQKTLLIKQFSNPDKKKLTAAIYARKSSEDENATSIDTQITDCRLLIQANADIMELNERYIYKDEAKSGMFQDNRHEFQELLTEARNGNVDVIVFYHHERLTRNVGDFNTIKAELERRKVFLVFGNAYYENTNMGEFYANLSFAMAQFEARTAATKTARTLHLRAEKGKSAGGRAPYGLKCIGKQFDIEETEAPAVKLLFDMAERKESYEKIIAELTAQGYQTRAGKPFSKATLSDMLRNWKYAGVYVYCRKDKAGNPVNRKNHRVLLGEQDEVRNDDTVLRAIVTKRQFLKVQEMLDARELGSTKQNARPEYLLSGLVRCECGKAMYGESVKGKRGKGIYRYYSCANQRSKQGCNVPKTDADYLETAVKKVVYREVQTLLRENALSSVMLAAKQKEYQGKIGHLSRKIQDIERENGKLARKLLNVEESVATVLEKKIKDNTEVLRTMRQKSEKLQKIVKYMETLQGKNGQTIEEARLFADLELTRKLIRTFVKEITVGKDNIEIQLNN